MNPVIENIKNRRSVRMYDTKPIPKNILQEIIDAGNCAPSGANAQGWRFVVVQDEPLRKKMASLALPRYKKWMEKVSPQLKEMRKEVDARESDPIYCSAPVVVFVIGWGMSGELDTPMVCQNMMLAARSFGIGSCWIFIGQLIIDDQDIRNVLELKDGEKVYGPILLGYPKKEFPKGPAKKPAQVKWI